MPHVLLPGVLGALVDVLVDPGAEARAVAAKLRLAS